MRKAAERQKVKNLRKGDRVETSQGPGTIGELWTNSRTGTIYRAIKLDNGKETCESGGQTLTVIKED